MGGGGGGGTVEVGASTHCIVGAIWLRENVVGRMNPVPQFGEKIGGRLSRNRGISSGQGPASHVERSGRKIPLGRPACGAAGDRRPRPPLAALSCP